MIASIWLFWNKLSNAEKISLMGVCMAALGLIITAILKPTLTRKRILLSVYSVLHLLKKRVFWSILLLSFCFATLFYFLTNTHLLVIKTNKYLFIGCIIFLLCFGLLALANRYVRKRIHFFKPYLVSVYETFLVDSMDEVYVNTNTEVLNDVILDVYNRIGSKLFSHSAPFIFFRLERTPKFYYYLKGKSIGRYILKQIEKQNRLATLYFLIEKETQQVTPVLNFDRTILTNTQLVDTATGILNTITSDKSLSKRDVIEITTKIYFLLFSQIANHVLLDSKEYAKVHYILDESDSLLNQIKDDISLKGIANNNGISELLIFWKSYIERYRSTVFIQQKEYLGALKHLFNSIRLNPHFPYKDYISLKQDYTKKYALELLPELDITSSEMKLETNSEENNRIAEALAKQVEYFDIAFSYYMIREITDGDSSAEMMNAIKKELQTLSNTSPFISLTKCEILKYIPKGDKMFNALYVDRIPECQKLLQEVLDADNDFPLIHTKLGTLLMIKGVVYDNMQLIDEGMEEWKKGMHFFSKVGIDIKRKGKNNKEDEKNPG